MPNDRKTCHQLLWWYTEQDLCEGMYWEPVPCSVPNSASVLSLTDLPLQEALDQLRKDMENFQDCPISKVAQHTVFADGNPHSSLMLVGEAPGAEEDRLGKPFVGMSGQLLDRMMAAIGLNRESFYVTNILPWRPPFNRQPSSEEIAMCLPFVERHIALIQPKVLLCVGSVACRALLRTTDSMKILQGKNLSYTSPYLCHPVLTFAIYHPAYLLRLPGQKGYAWRQLLRVQECLSHSLT